METVQERRKFLVGGRGGVIRAWPHFRESLTEEQHKGVKDINFNFNRAKTLLDGETNIKFLSFKGNNLFICGKLYTAIS